MKSFFMIGHRTLYSLHKAQPLGQHFVQVHLILLRLHFFLRIWLQLLKIAPYTLGTRLFGFAATERLMTRALGFRKKFANVANMLLEFGRTLEIDAIFVFVAKLEVTLTGIRVPGAVLLGTILSDKIVSSLIKASTTSLRFLH